MTEEKERLNPRWINRGKLSIVVNHKDNGKASVPQNKNSEANKTNASLYYNLFVDILFFPPSSPASSVIVFLYVRCPEMCLHLCLENI